MGGIKVGDIVARKSYGCDVFFKVVDIRNAGDENIITLKGISYRIEADAPESDLEVQPETAVRDYRNKERMMVENKKRSMNMARNQRMRFGGFPKAYYRDTPKDNNRMFSRAGKILHLDGDEEYLETCLAEYRKLKLEAVGKYIPEKDQPAAIRGLLEQYRPDIVVITGHDGVLKGDKGYLSLSNYRNSRYFIEAVREARKFNPDLDALVIFAGACQSMYKEIINAGANYASAPHRVLIHALDPVLVCEKIALTGIGRVLTPDEVIMNTLTGEKGIGGLETRGKKRDGYPVEPYEA